YFNKGYLYSPFKWYNKINLLMFVLAKQDICNNFLVIIIVLNYYLEPKSNKRAIKAHGGIFL
ncbi:hypothetical protein, partial [Virgibacillus sp. DJP39]|uniref:hypothetical protein n=1 Tax=Virgibacillus sp. DJP39 TaxID=3409790 RepID=UPI003BB6E271